MSYPKDTYYEKPPAGGSTHYPQMVPTQPGQYFPPNYPNAPPPYSAVPPVGPGAAVPTYQSAQYAYSTGVPGQPQVYQSSSMVSSAPPPYANYGQPAYNTGYPVQQGFTYSVPPVAAAQFDAGARFDGIASQNIPPPPPGYAPNAAQMAAAQGGTVIATQKQSNWFAGNGGGISFW